MKRVTLIHNPVAGPRDEQADLAQVVDYLRAHGCDVSLHLTQRHGDAAQTARCAAVEGHEIVLVAGGDGTLNEAVNGLIGSRTALGVLPTGTGNVWAKELGLPVYSLTSPHSLLAAAQLMCEATVRVIDVGRANALTGAPTGGRYFLLWAGVGFDAQVAAELEPRERFAKQLGVLPYLIASVQVSRAFRGERTTVWADGEVIRGHTLLVVVSNTQLYGGYVRITPSARLDDGYLDVCIFKGFGTQDLIAHVLGVFSGRHLRDPKVKFMRARHIQVYAPKPWRIHLDGDPIGSTPMSFQVIPAALHVLIPRTAPAALFE